MKNKLPEFDVADMRLYLSMDAKSKLEYLEKMNRFLQKITPEKAKQRNQRLKKEGF